MASNDATQVLDELLATLETRLTASGTDGREDAIDAVLGSPARTTNVTSLREAPEVASFREALIDGLIRVDTANRLLRLVNEIVIRLV
jgi:hypothetical protein